MGVADEVKGRTKEAVGALTDDKKLKHEGKADRVAGKVKDAFGKLVDALKRPKREPS